MPNKRKKIELPNKTNVKKLKNSPIVQNKRNTTESLKPNKQLGKL